MGLAGLSNASVPKWKTPTQWDRDGTGDWPDATTNKQRECAFVCMSVCKDGKNWSSCQSMVEKCTHDLNLTIVMFWLRLEQIRKAHTWL